MSSEPIVSPPEATAVAYRAFLTEYGLTNTLRIFEEEWHMLLQRAHSSRTAAAAAVSNNHGEASTDVREGVELTSTIHAVQPAATRDEDDEAMATVRSMDTTTNDDSTPKQPCAPPPSLMGSATLSAVSLPDPSPLLAAADAPAVPQEAAAVSPSNEVVVNKYGIISGPGLEEHLWELVEDQPEAPVFPYGAGYQAEVLHKCGIDIDADVPRVATHPYLKEPPPSGLPLESFDLRVIYEAGRTGFEEAKDFPIVPGSVIAGRYQILQYLDSAAFSRAVKCLDLKHQHEVCIKIIRNSKDFFDQSLDEIKLLQYINAAGNADENCVLQLYDFFYFKEHIFIVCELLRDNLYEFSKYNREHESEAYFTLARVQAIARQVLTGLAFIHDMSLMHCDLKPENILVKSYSRCEVRVIDFGSSCFTTDNLSSYIQSRCYRAPEVILGCHYDGRIDVWSVGCILPELMTGNVMFHNKTVAGMLTRIAGVCGPFPQRMLHEGRHTCRFVTKHGLFYESKEATGDIECHFPATTPFDKLDLGTSDAHFRDLIRQALTVDYTLRPTAKQLLRHPFFQQDYGAVFSAPPQKRSLKGGAASPQ